MKKKISKFAEGFEIGKAGQSSIYGGREIYTGYYELNNQACSPSCPDYRLDASDEKK